jgi:hypothetical protein
MNIVEANINDLPLIMECKKCKEEIYIVGALPYIECVFCGAKYYVEVKEGE